MEVTGRGEGNLSFTLINVPLTLAKIKLVEDIDEFQSLKDVLFFIKRSEVKFFNLYNYLCLKLRMDQILNLPNIRF